jgi:hypothetical protein
MNSYTRRILMFLAIGAGLLVGGCVTYGDGTVAIPAGERRYEIPPGQMPPPGECRVWFPGRPPGQQPPPGNCSDLQRQVPPGAVLVRG